MSLQVIFNIVVVVYTVTNLASMGLELNLREALKTLRSVRAIALIFLWGWVVGPVLAWLIIRIIPLREAHAAGLLLVSLAPTAPFFPVMVRKAQGDRTFAGAFMLLTTIGTVVFLPLLVPLLIKGLAVDYWSLTKPLLILVLVPMLIGSFVRVFAPNTAKKLFPWVSQIGGIFLILAVGFTVVLYGGEMLGAVGSFAPGSLVLFLIAIAVLSYKIHFGLEQQQRSSMSLGMCTRNVAVMVAAYTGITNPPPGLFVMIILVVPLSAIVAMAAAHLFARQVPIN